MKKITKILLLVMVFGYGLAFALSKAIPKTESRSNYFELLLKTYGWHSKIHVNTETTRYKETLDPKDIQSVRLLVISANVKTLESPDDKIHIECETTMTQERFNQIVHTAPENGLVILKFNPEIERNSGITISLSSDNTQDNIDEVIIRVPKKISAMDIVSISGDVDYQNKSPANLTIHTISGEISLKGAVANLELKTISGDVAITTDTVTPKFKIETISGDIEIQHSQNLNAKIDYQPVSGDIEITNADSRSVTEGRLEQQIGNGEGSIFIKTTSGDAKLTKLAL